MLPMFTLKVTLAGMVEQEAFGLMHQQKKHRFIGMLKITFTMKLRGNTNMS